MINKFIKLFLVLFVATLQMSVLPVIFPENMVPNLVLILLCAWILMYGFNNTLPWIIVSGFVYDLILFHPIGLNVIFFLIIGYFISFAAQRFLVEDKFWSFVFIFLVSVFIAFSIYYFNKGYVYMKGWDFFLIIFQKKEIKFIFILGILNMFLYYILLTIIKPIDQYLSMYESRIKIK